MLASRRGAPHPAAALLSWVMVLAPVTMLLVCGLVFLAGLVDSIAGGGGLISLPAYFAAGLPPHMALATNKFSSTCGTATTILPYWRSGAMRLSVSLIAAAGAVLGSMAGARLALACSPETITAIMLILVPAVLFIFLLKDRLLRLKRRTASAEDMAGPALAIGLAVGTYDGFFGPGTGTFLTIAFTMVLGFSLLSAAAGARVANLASNTGSLAVFLIHGKVLFPLAVFAAGAGMAGNFIGAHLAVRHGDRVIRPVIVVVMILLLGEVIRRRWFS